MTAPWWLTAGADTWLWVLAPAAAFGLIAIAHNRLHCWYTRRANRRADRQFVAGLARKQRIGAR